MEIKENLNHFISNLLHKYPFLFIDKIISVNPEEAFIETLKNVTINEYFFQGHFQNHPIYPGVLIIESFAQSANLLCNIIQNTKDIYLFALTKINKAKFIHFVLPGDTLIFKISLLKNFNEFYFLLKGEAFANNKKVAISEFTIMKIKKLEICP